VSASPPQINAVSKFAMTSLFYPRTNWLANFAAIPGFSETPSDVVAAILIAPPLTSVRLNPVALMKVVHGV
jgi:hypothetical protein